MYGGLKNERANNRNVKGVYESKSECWGCLTNGITQILRQEMSWHTLHLQHNRRVMRGWKSLEIVDKYEKSVKTWYILFKVCWFCLTSVGARWLTPWLNLLTQGIAFCEILMQYKVQSWYAEMVNTVLTSVLLWWSLWNYRSNKPKPRHTPKVIHHWRAAGYIPKLINRVLRK